MNLNPNILRSGIFLAALLGLVLLLPPAVLAQESEAADSAAAMAEDETDADADAAAGGESVAESADPAAVQPDPGSPGMSLPFDGSSVEAFEGSLATIQAEVTDLEYQTLTNALDYLLVYDLGARRDKELLYQRLDGKTPNDVLKMVKWRGKGTGRIRGRGSREANTTDT